MFESCEAGLIGAIGWDEEVEERQVADNGSEIVSFRDILIICRLHSLQRSLALGETSFEYDDDLLVTSTCEVNTM